MCKERLTPEEIETQMDAQVELLESLYSVDEEEYGDRDVSRK